MGGDEPVAMQRRLEPGCPRLLFAGQQPLQAAEFGRGQVQGE
jgi:hypothetical protein